MALYLDEFLYRGKPPGSPDAPDYHVIVGSVTTDDFGIRSFKTGPAMTPGQAQAKGFELPTIIRAINTSVMNENAALKAQVASLEAQIAASNKESG